MLSGDCSRSGDLSNSSSQRPQPCRAGRNPIRARRATFRIVATLSEPLSHSLLNLTSRMSTQETQVIDITIDGDMDTDGDWSTEEGYGELLAGELIEHLNDNCSDLPAAVRKQTWQIWMSESIRTLQAATWKEQKTHIDLTSVLPIVKKQRRK